MSTIKVNTLQDTSGKGYYPARAWVNFNGQGTVSMRDTASVSSITDRGTGLYTINFSNAFGNSSYSAGGSVGFNGSGGDCWQFHTNQSSYQTSTALKIHVSRYVSAFDPLVCCVSAVGDM